MTVCAGADGCRAGWIVVWRDAEGGALGHELVAGARGLVARAPQPDLLVVDIPIGLPDAGPRACDVEARQRLGVRGSSVFPAPLRAALDAPDHRTAHERTCAANAAAGRRATGLSIQAFGILAKVRDVDRVLTPVLQRRIREGHPELAFRRWAHAALPPKRTRAGRLAREQLVDAEYGPQAFAEIRSEYRVADVSHDDLLDAFACLHVAEGALRGEALVLPDGAPQRDARGLRMEILA